MSTWLYKTCGLETGLIFHLETGLIFHHEPKIFPPSSGVIHKMLFVGHFFKQRKKSHKWFIPIVLSLLGLVLYTP